MSSFGSRSPVVGLSLYVLLHLLALAIGLSTVDQLNARTFAVTAAIVSVFILLASVFLGGFVASRATVGEQPSEAMGYGVLVWGTMLLVLLVGWFAYRVVNLPTFAEFLIATEAEMNKVSWTSRRRLYQDTIVVLVTTVLLTLFLLVVDLFWGWLLSRQTVGVLPSKATDTQQKAGQREETRW